MMEVIEVLSWAYLSACFGWMQGMIFFKLVKGD